MCRSRAVTDPQNLRSQRSSGQAAALLSSPEAPEDSPRKTRIPMDFHLKDSHGFPPQGFPWISISEPSLGFLSPPQDFFLAQDGNSSSQLVKSWEFNESQPIPRTGLLRGSQSNSHPRKQQWDSFPAGPSLD